MFSEGLSQRSFQILLLLDATEVQPVPISLLQSAPCTFDSFTHFAFECSSPYNLVGDSFLGLQYSSCPEVVM